MKFILSITLLVYVLSTASCSLQESKPKVYLGFRLGTSGNTATEHREQLLKQNQIKEKDGVWYHNETVTQNGNKYYSTPIFQINAGDTLISKIRVLYFDNLESTDDLMRDTREGNTGSMMYLSYKGQGESSPGFFAKLDILNEMTKKYGNCKSKDTSNLMGIYKEEYKWEQNGLNVELVYAIWKANNETSSLRLDYSLTEVKNKI